MPFFSPMYFSHSSFQPPIALQHKEHLVLQRTRANTCHLVCHLQTWWHSLRLRWHCSARARAFKCKRCWGNSEVNVLKIHRYAPFCRGIFNACPFAPCGRRRGTGVAADAGTDGRTSPPSKHESPTAAAFHPHVLPWMSSLWLNTGCLKLWSNCA